MALYRISLTYDAPAGVGKTTAHTDTYHGGFAKLVPNERVIEVVEFETADPAFRGEMTITITLADARGRHRAARRARWTAAWPIACRQRDRLANGTRKARRTPRDGLDNARPLR